MSIKGAPQKAQEIFDDVVEKTGVTIEWEPGKRDNEQRKESVIKLRGTTEGVNKAKDMILQNLESQSNRVALKMDIPHEEHKFLIGKKGILNKQVMEATNTLIHYPDINLRAPTIKSNQVSITGDPGSVEKARVMLRALIPFQITFEIDIPNSHVMSTTFPSWKKLEEIPGFDIHFIQTKDKVTVVLRCSQGLFPTIRHQISSLIELLSQKRGSDLPPVKAVMDIMPQNHCLVRGHKGNNIEAIVSKTGAKILFNNFNTNITERRYVIIIGNLDSVYMAWQELMSLLPATVSFDVSETREPNNDGFSNILLDSNICIYTKSKQRYIKAVILKGPEKNCKQILQLHQRILNLAAIKFASDNDIAKQAMSFQTNNVDITDLQILENIRSIFQSLETIFRPAIVRYNATSYGPFEYVIPANNERLYERSRSCTISPAVLSLYTNSSYSSDILWAQNALNNNEAVREESKSSYEQSSTIFNTENRHSNSSVVRDPTIDQRLSAYHAIHRQIESPQVPSSLWAGYGFSQSMPAAFTTKDREPLNRYSSASLESNQSSSSDDSFSSILISDYFDDNIWSSNADNAFSLSNVFDFKTNTSLPTKFNHKDILPELLYKEGLYNYIDIFLREEIDYTAFLLLNESDLINLGINYPARMKILCLIRELQDANLLQDKHFDAAPGAGRKMTENP